MQIWNLKRKDMLRRNLIKSGIGIIIRNPKLIVNLFNFNKAYCSYFQSKLKYAKKIYEECKLKNCSNDELYEQIKKINKKILDQYSRNVPLAEYNTDSREIIKSLLSPEKVGVCVSKNLKKRWNLILGDRKNFEFLS